MNSETSKRRRGLSTGRRQAAEQAQLRLARFRNEMLEGLKRRIRECLGPQPPYIRRYYKAYVRALQGDPVPCRRAEVIRAVLAAKVVYVGDFHTNPAAQRAEFELLETLVRAGRPITLAVEMFAREDQDKVDRFQNRLMGEKEFLSRVRYNQSWGFRWENYRAILELAAAEKIPVLALNCKTNARLGERDRAAAELIAAAMKKDPERLVFVVHGDLHLAPSHLPAEVAKRAKRSGEPRVIVFQNSESVYRRLHGEPWGEEVEAVRFDEGRYCLLNTPPLVKMQGYLSWLENTERLLLAEPGPLRFGLTSDDPGEFADEFEMLTKSLSSFFGLKAPDTEAYELRILDDVDFLSEIETGPGTYALSRLVRDRRAAIFPDPAIVYLPDTDVVTGATAAMGLLLRSASGDERTDLYGPGAFSRRIVDRTLEFFAAKLVHPALEGTRPVDLLRLAERAHAGPIPRKLRRRVEVARILPQWIESLESGIGPSEDLTALLVRTDRKLAFDLSRSAGEWMGEGLFESYRRGRTPVAGIAEAIGTAWTEPLARHRVAEWGASFD